LGNSFEGANEDPVLPKPKLPPPTDHEIVDLLRSDLREEQGRGATALVDRYAGPLRKYAGGLFQLSGDDAETIVFRVLERVSRRIDTLDDPGRLGPWVYQIVYNEARNWVKRRKPDEVAGHRADLDELVGHRRADELVFEDEVPLGLGERTDEVRVALESMSERNKEILSAIVSGLSNEDLAALFRVTLNYARLLRKRALDDAKLRLEGIIRPAADVANVEESDGN
jgi:RNA polymerase sigma factor (sigma-70 family)